MATHDTLFLAGGHELHAGLRLVFRDAVVERHEFRLVRLHRPIEPRAGLGLGVAAGADRRMAEDHGRDVFIAEVPAFHAAEQPVRRAPAGRHCHRRQRRAARDIAERADVRHVGDLIVIHRDEARRIARDAGRRQVELRRDRITANGPDHRIEGPVPAAVGGREHESPGTGRSRFMRPCFTHERRRYRAGHHVDAVGGHRGHQPLLEILIEVAQRAILADQEAHRRAQRIQDPGEFHRDVARAHHRHAFWTALQREEVVGGQAQFGARNGRHHRPAAGGDHDVWRQQQPVARRHAVRRGESRAGNHVLDALFFQVPRIDPVQPLDIGLAFGDKARPVMAAHGQVEAVAARIVEGMGQLGGIERDLLRHAADVDAGATQRRRLDQCHPRTVLRGPLRGRESGAATADHDQVEGFGSWRAGCIHGVPVAASEPAV